MGQYPLGITNMLKRTNSKQFGNIHSGIGNINLKQILIENIIIIIYIYGL